MTVDEIYLMLANLLNDAIEEDFQFANIYIDRLDKYVASEGHYTNLHNEQIKIEELGFRFANAMAIHELHSITTEGGHNRWNKLKFTLYPTGKFEMEFIWDQEYQDMVDNVK